MKKALLVLLMVLVGVGATLAFADRGDDFKVIQNGVKAEKGAIPAWFRLEVKEKGKSKVQIRIPLSLAEMLADSCPEKANLVDHCKIDLKAVLGELKRAGALVEITDEEDTVRIWVE